MKKLNFVEPLRFVEHSKDLKEQHKKNPECKKMYDKLKSKFNKISKKIKQDNKRHILKSPVGFSFYGLDLKTLEKKYSYKFNGKGSWLKDSKYIFECTKEAMGIQTGKMVLISPFLIREDYPKIDFKIKQLGICNVKTKTIYVFLPDGNYLEDILKNLYIVIIHETAHLKFGVFHE